MTDTIKGAAVAGAVLSTVALWLLAGLLEVELRIDPRNGQPPGVLGLPFAAAVTLVVALLGWALRALLDRLTRRAASVWTVVAVLVLAASFLPVAGVGASTGTRVVLALAHLAVGAVLIPVFGRPARTRAPRPGAPGADDR
jgi:hypothetical protein